jgi:hypothetical protein
MKDDNAPVRTQGSTGLQRIDRTINPWRIERNHRGERGRVA